MNKKTNIMKTNILIASSFITLSFFLSSCRVNSERILSQHNLDSSIEKVKHEKVKSSHHTFYSEIIINATPSEVWAVLTDFDNYTWSNALKELKGDFRDGGEVEIVYYTDYEKKKTQTYKHIINVIEGKEFSWSDPFEFGMSDHHIYRIEDAGNGKTKFIQIDECKGGATWMFGNMVSKHQLETYPKFNRLLKAEVEKRKK